MPCCVLDETLAVIRQSRRAMELALWWMEGGRGWEGSGAALALASARVCVRVPAVRTRVPPPDWAAEEHGRVPVPAEDTPPSGHGSCNPHKSFRLRELRTRQLARARPKYATVTR